MRLGIVRNDLGRGVYIADIASRNQYPYASAVAGQARTLRKPTDVEFYDIVQDNPVPVAVTGQNTATAVNSAFATGGLSVRVTPGGTFATVAVGGTAAALKTYIRDQLNAGFATGGIPLTASVEGTNQLRITSNVRGEQAYVEFASQGSAGFTGGLGFVLGISPVAVAGPAQATLAAALRSTVYTGQAFNVSTGAVATAGFNAGTGARVDFSLLGATGLLQFRERVAEAVAPAFVEGGDVLLSFANGIVAQLRSPNFVDGGVTGPALFATLDDGVTPFTYP